MSVCLCIHVESNLSDNECDKIRKRLIESCKRFSAADAVLFTLSYFCSMKHYRLQSPGNLLELLRINKKQQRQQQPQHIDALLHMYIRYEMLL